MRASTRPVTSDKRDCRTGQLNCVSLSESGGRAVILEYASTTDEGGSFQCTVNGGLSGERDDVPNSQRWRARGTVRLDNVWCECAKEAPITLYQFASSSDLLVHDRYLQTVQVAAPFSAPGPPQTQLRSESVPSEDQGSPVEQHESDQRASRLAGVYSPWIRPLR